MNAQVGLPNVQQKEKHGNKPTGPKWGHLVTILLVEFLMEKNKMKTFLK